MPASAEIVKEIELPEGVKVDLESTTGELALTGPLGSLTRKFNHPKIQIEIKDSKILITCKLPRRKDNALLGTWFGHVKNMVVGITSGFEYKMKIVYSHFPIKTHVKDNELIIENFLGEKQPRKAKMVGETKVKVSGDQIVLNGIDIEAAGQSAANIERATQIKGYDSRVFQDGIYLVEHPKK
ncbi:50S ribosomal protein L6 [[Eubacterium] cellulosolvens]